MEGHRLDGLGCLPGVLEVNPQVGALQHKFQKVVQHLIIDQVDETVQFQQITHFQLHIEMSSSNQSTHTYRIKSYLGLCTLGGIIRLNCVTTHGSV